MECLVFTPMSSAIVGGCMRSEHLGLSFLEVRGNFDLVSSSS